MTTINFVRKATEAEIVHGKPSWNARIDAYYQAYSRRLRREARDKGEYGNASECLIALSARMVDIVAC
jgi:hypothetical protein